MGEANGARYTAQGIVDHRRDDARRDSMSEDGSPHDSPWPAVRSVDVSPHGGLRPDEQVIVSHGEHYIISLNDPTDPAGRPCMIEHTSSMSSIPSPAPTSPMPNGITSSPSSASDSSPFSPSDSPPKKRSVRFRSRVRITSGVRGHFVLPDTPPAAFRARSPSSSSSISDSSSISAPLRWRDGEKSLRDRPGWGTLGQRVSLLAGGSGRRQRVDDGNGDVGGGSGGPGRPPTVHEGTPLMQSSIPRQYVYADEEEDEERLRREIDLVFGKWPGRLLNSNWWWWQLEPFVCCHCICSDESDIED
ncbi:hypothetical protein GGG16DRAFT_96663 [Schizophyllum commune]